MDIHEIHTSNDMLVLQGEKEQKSFIRNRVSVTQHHQPDWGHICPRPLEPRALSGERRDWRASCIRGDCRRGIQSKWLILTPKEASTFLFLLCFPQNTSLHSCITLRLSLKRGWTLRSAMPLQSIQKQELWIRESGILAPIRDIPLAES